MLCSIAWYAMTQLDTVKQRSYICYCYQNFLLSIDINECLTTMEVVAVLVSTLGSYYWVVLQTCWCTLWHSKHPAMVILCDGELIAN